MTNNTYQIQAVIFDMDGLMLDTERIARIAWRRAAADWGRTLSDELFAAITGLNATDANAVLQEAFGPTFPVTAARRRRQRYYEAYIAEHGIELKPGLLPLLEEIEARQLPHAVASSTPRAGVLYKLTLAGLVERFEILVGGDEVAQGKPAPDIFLEAAARLDVGPRHCLVLEDSEAGIRAAHAAGMLPVMVPDVKEPAPEIAALAYAVLPALEAAIPLLRRLARLPARLSHR
ncbi:MAG: HAD family hydrolase [Anaerolineae bacterium]